jgi:hypothetical protein
MVMMMVGWLRLLQLRLLLLPCELGVSLVEKG